MPEPFLLRRAVKISDLIAHFDKLEILPVEIDAVVAHLRSGGIDHEIYYFPADISKDILTGQITHWSYPDNNGVEKQVVDIFYEKTLADDWARLVCCKELIHILDPVSCRVSAPEKVRHLIERIVLPTELHDAKKDGNGVINDRFTVYHAIAILFPWACRQLLKPQLDAKKLTYKDIATMTCLPMKYVVIVMSDVWEELYPFIAKGLGEK